MTDKTAEEIKAEARKWQQAYRKTPEYQEWLAKRRADPERKERKKLYKRQYKLTPEGKLRTQIINLRATVKRYGLTLDDWDRMLIEQSGRCACCSAQMMQPNEPAVDHNHTTGQVRGLLCNNCNLGIGHFDESVERLQLAIQYLSAF